MSDWLIYTRHCPVCGQGLCRVRTCDATETVHQFLLCDECNAVWTDPNQMPRSPQTDASQPQCPKCCADVWGGQTRWSTLLETIAANWYGHVYIDRDRTE